MKKSYVPLVMTWLVLGFIYLPMSLLVLNSFNLSRFGTKWQGVTAKWYMLLWERTDLWSALWESVKVASVASLVAMCLGTLAAFAMHHYRSRMQHYHQVLVMLPLVFPEILMGMSLLLLFVSLGIKLGYVTVLCAHITFCVSYVAFLMKARLHDFDFQLVDAARDLGASPIQAYVKVVLPLLAPGMIAAGLLAFTLSIDDFVVTFFVKGAGGDTLPIVIYGMIKKSRDLPVVNALSTLLLLCTFALVWVSQRLQAFRL